MEVTIRPVRKNAWNSVDVARARVRETEAAVVAARKEHRDARTHLRDCERELEKAPR